MSTEDSLDKILRDLLSSIAEIKGAAIVSPEGLPIASALRPDVDETRIAAMTAALLSLGERAGHELDKGTLEQVYVKGERGYVLVMSAGMNAVLTVETTRNIRLGLVFLDCRRACERISHLV
ncbi:MAG: roadblock/LC7 domain-containing protein [Candidatus Lokiarchaeota archaeon]|nr:roadblock/LC7 domain-containing protein [Candidatus Lokiarchaeota archaeon]